MELDFSEQIIAGRPGPKSGAQTPSKPEERKKGSSKNEPGSAGTSPDSKEKSKKILERKDDKELVKESKAKITFSEKVTTSLKNLAEKLPWVCLKRFTEEALELFLEHIDQVNQELPGQWPELICFSK